MEPITGFLIRYHRLQQNISQEGLCKGICVVSYLSKIEQGQVQAGDDIIHQLFAVLGIHYHDDPVFIKQYVGLIHDYFVGYFLDEDISEIQNKLLSVEHELINSPLCIPMQMVRLHIALQENIEGVDEQLKQLQIFLHMMNENQLFLYYYLSGCATRGEKSILLLNKAGNYKQCSIQKHRLGYAYLYNGRHGEAVENFRKSYDLACEEGNAHMMLMDALMLGNCYSSSKEAELMMKCFEKCEMLARTMHQKDVLSLVQYNLGASYLEWNQFDKAEHYLKECIKHIEDRYVLSAYQKLALLYCELNKEEEMETYLHKADECNIEDELNLKIHTFVHLYCDKTTKTSDVCIQLLEEICYQNETVSYGYRAFYAKYLYRLYIRKRRYKDALQITNHINHNIS